MLAHPEWDGCGLARCCCGGLVSYWRACGGGRLVPQCIKDQLTFEVGLCLDLSYLAPGPKEPLGLGPAVCPALEGHLQPTFRPTLP